LATLTNVTPSDSPEDLDGGAQSAVGIKAWKAGGKAVMTESLIGPGYACSGCRCSWRPAI